MTSSAAALKGASATAVSRARRKAAIGVTLIVVMACCFATMDTTIRHLGVTIPVLVLLTVRYAFQAVVMTIWLGVDRNATYKSSHPKFQALRGSLLLATSATSFFALQYMPVPEFTAINMLTPVLVTLLAAWVLRERVSPIRWALIAGGFTGAVIVIRPGSGLFGWAVLLPLVGAFFYAAFQLLTSRLSALESPYTTHFWTAVTGTVILLPVLWASGIDVGAVLSAATPMQFGLMALLGTLGTFGHLMLILALGMAPASTLMPFVYVQIGAAAFLGWLVFQQLPDGPGWIGIAIIALCGGASAWLNVRSSPATQHPASRVEADTIAD